MVWGCTLNTCTASHQMNTQWCGQFCETVASAATCHSQNKSGWTESVSGPESVKFINSDFDSGVKTTDTWRPDSAVHYIDFPVVGSGFRRWESEVTFKVPDNLAPTSKNAWRRHWATPMRTRLSRRDRRSSSGDRFELQLAGAPERPLCRSIIVLYCIVYIFGKSTQRWL